MKKEKRISVNIVRAYTTPPLNFDLSSAVIVLLRNCVQNEIIPAGNFSKVKAQIIEIILTPAHEKTFAEKISKSEQSKYLSFHFWIAYPKVVRSVTENLLTDMDLAAFVSEFMFCLKESFIPYDIPETLFAETDKKLLNSIASDLPKYTYVLTPEESQIRLALHKIL